MENYQPNKIIHVCITDDSDISFYFDAGNNSIITESTETGCTITMDKDAYLRILHAERTCEEEIHNNNIKIMGDVGLIRDLGKAFRLKWAKS